MPRLTQPALSSRSPQSPRSLARLAAVAASLAVAAAALTGCGGTAQATAKNATYTTTPSDTREAASRALGFTEASLWESRSSGTFAPSGRSPSRGYLMKA